MAVHIDKKYSPEYILFKYFARFIVSLDDPSLLHGGFPKEAVAPYLNHMSPDSVRNLFTDTGNTAAVVADRFQFFCQQFEERFLRLSTVEQQQYTDTYTAFIDWRNRIFKKHGWNIQSLSTNENEQQKELQSDYGVASFIEDLKKKYKSYNREERFYERWTFKQWLDAISENSSLPKFVPDEMRNSLISNIILALSDLRLDIFIRDDDKLVAKHIFLENIEHTECYQLRSFCYSDGTHNMLAGKFRYYLDERVIVIGHDKEWKGMHGADHVYVFHTPVVLTPYPQNFDVTLFGYYMTRSETKEIRTIPIAGTFTYKGEGIVMDASFFKLNDEHVPFRIRAFLNESDKDYPKTDLPDDFIYKALVHFNEQLTSTYRY